MKVLLVDHGSSFIGQLHDILFPAEIKVVDWRQLTRYDWEWSDVVVLSGGHSQSVARHHRLYLLEFELIQSTSKPVIGICLGCQVLAAAYGAKLKRLPYKVRGIRRIAVIKNGPLFRGLKYLEVYQSHFWAITAISSELEGLAMSRNGFEIIKHRQKRQYGFQFHPEVSTQSTAGRAMIQNVLRMVTLSKKSYSE